MKDLTKGNIAKNLWLFVIPVLISELFSYMLSTIDQVMLGKLVGDVGLAAVGATSSYFNILWGMHGALSFAFGARLAYLVGTGDGGLIKRTYKINMRVNAVLGLAIAGGSILLWRPIFAFLNVPADIFEETKRYYLIYAASFSLFILSANMRAALQSFGNTVLPMRVGLVGAICNVALNYVMIVLLHMGAAGAALATMTVSAGTSAVYALKLHFELKALSGEGGRARLAEYAPIFKMVIPTALQQMMMYLFAFAAQPSINTMGKSAIAAMSVGQSLASLVAIGYNQMSKGMSTFVGQALGHGQPSLIRRGVRITVRHILILTLPLILVLLIFPRIAPRIFLDDPYGETASLVILYIYWCVPFSLALAFNRMLHNFFRGVLRPGFNIAGGLAMGITRAALTIALIPVIGIYGAFIGYSAGWTADFLVMFILYISQKWKTKEYRDAERAEQEALAKACTPPPAGT